MPDWICEKFKGDMALYAICPRCNFTYDCGNALNGELKITNPYVFCPLCGEFLYESDTFDVIYNERDITDLYKMKRDCTVIEHAIEEANKNVIKQSD